MMNYEIFKEVVKEKFLDHMPDDFANHTVVIHPVNKVNETLDGLSLQSPNGESRQISPTIYINHMYEDYQKSNDLQSTLDMAAFNMAGAFRAGEQLQTDFNFEDAKDKIVMALVNTEQNREMLKNMPHREFQDLSVIYRYVVSMEPLDTYHQEREKAMEQGQERATQQVQTDSRGFMQYSGEQLPFR